MNRETIVNMIDKKIFISLADGHSILYIKNDICARVDKFLKEIKNLDNGEVLLGLDINSIQPSRAKYQIIYIKESLKRIEDLDWMIKNKHKFSKLSDYQIFNLLKLKERLSEENSVPF
jgi:hypothetical protein